MMWIKTKTSLMRWVQRPFCVHQFAQGASRVNGWFLDKKDIECRIQPNTSYLQTQLIRIGRTFPEHS